MTTFEDNIASELAEIIEFAKERHDAELNGFTITLGRETRARLHGYIGEIKTHNAFSFYADTCAECLDALRKKVAGLPSAKERRRNDAAVALANAIEKARAADLEVEFVNPLEIAMKRLSENALTHHPTPTRDDDQERAQAAGAM